MPQPPARNRDLTCLSSVTEKHEAIGTLTLSLTGEAKGVFHPLKRALTSYQFNRILGRRLLIEYQKRRFVALIWTVGQLILGFRHSLDSLRSGPQMDIHAWSQWLQGEQRCLQWADGR